jgi:hypothetical protein
MLSRGLECFLKGWNAFDRVDIPRTGLECFLEGWNTFYSDGIPLYRVGMLSIGLECIRQSWNPLVQSWNAF